MPHRAALLVCHTCGMAVKRKVWHRWGMARDDLHFRLRIPEDLKSRIEASASANHHSMTAEIVSRLEKSFSEEKEIDHWRKLAGEDLEERRMFRDFMRESADLLDQVQEQQARLLSLLEAVAATDGNLSPDLMAALRGVVASRGTKDADA